MKSENQTVLPQSVRILIACEYSGVVRDAFIRRGFDAWSCDILPTASPGPHLQCDVLSILDQGWDMMLGYPPCTYLCNSGAGHLYYTGLNGKLKKPQRWKQMRDGADFFRALWDAPIKRKCLENPIMLGHAMKMIGLTPTQVIHPWMFGHMEQKSTCLYLDNLPPLTESNNVYDEMMKLPKNQRERIHYMGPSKNRGLDRAKTFAGIAEAKAEQWGRVLLGLKPGPPTKFIP